LLEKNSKASQRIPVIRTRKIILNTAGKTWLLPENTYKKKSPTQTPPKKCINTSKYQRE
jgi:hypothetical protein